jgi:hypothetical protein
MKYLKTFELNSETYLRAGEKAKEYGQKNLAAKFYSAYNKNNITVDDFKDEKTNFYEKFLRKHSFKIITNTLEPLHLDTLKLSKSEIFNFYPTFVENDNNELIFYFSLSKDDKEYLYKNSYFTKDEDFSLLLTIRYDGEIKFFYGQRFYGVKEYVKFIKMLNKLYILQNSEHLNKMYSRLNDTEINSFEDGEFKKWIDKYFGDFDKFRVSVNKHKRKTYDSY